MNFNNEETAETAGEKLQKMAVEATAEALAAEEPEADVSFETAAKKMEKLLIAEMPAEDGNLDLMQLLGKDIPIDLATRGILADLSGDGENNALLFAKALANRFKFRKKGAVLRVYDDRTGVFKHLSKRPGDGDISMAQFIAEHVKPAHLRFIKITTTPAAVHAWLLSYPHFSTEMPDADVYAVAVKNGVYKLNSGKLRPFNPKYALIFSVNAAYTSDDWLPPELEEFFLILGGGNDGAEQLFGAIGIAISNYRSLQIALYIYGSTGTGKGTLARFLQKIMLQINAYHGLDLRDLANPFAPAQLEHCLFSIAPDLTKKQFSDKSLAVFKKLTGCDTFETQKKNVQHKVTTPHVFIIMMANFPPQIPPTFDETGELKRRFWIIKTEKTPQNPMPSHKLDALLWKYRDVIISRALRTASKFIANPDLIWKPDDAELYAQDGPLEPNALVEKFVKKRLKFTGDSSDFVATEDLFAAFREFCRAEGQPDDTISREGFGSRIRPFIPNAVKTRKNNVRGIAKYTFL